MRYRPLLIGIALGVALLLLSRRRKAPSRLAALPAVRTRQMAAADIEMWTEYLEAIDREAPKDAVETWARKHGVTVVRTLSRSRDRVEIAFERRGTGPGGERPPEPGPVATAAQKCRAIIEGQGKWNGVLTNYKVTCLCDCQKDAGSGEWRCTEHPHDCTVEFTKA